jgi:hypothetical protein
MSVSGLWQWRVIVFTELTLCSLVYFYRRFEGTCCHHICLLLIWRQQVLPESRETCTRLHGAIYLASSFPSSFTHSSASSALLHWWPVYKELVHSSISDDGNGSSLRTGIPRFIALRRYCVFYTLNVCGNPASSKSIGAIFVTECAHFVPLCHILVILAILEIFHYSICYGDLWSVISDVTTVIVLGNLLLVKMLWTLLKWQQRI